MKAVVALGAVGIPTLFLMVLLTKLREHRTDLTSSESEFDGASPIWQANVMRSENYDAIGRGLLRWYYLGLVAQALGLATGLYLLLV